MNKVFTARQSWYRNVYLKSEHWKNLRKAKKRVCPVCEICGAKRKLDVHHKNYRNIYDVLLEDLQVLCRRCHKKHHKKVNLLREFLKRHKRHKWLV